MAVDARGSSSIRSRSSGRLALQSASPVPRCPFFGRAPRCVRSVGKLTFSDADAMAGIADLRLRILPYAAEHAFRLFDLPTHHADPFDRQIIAQASWKTSQSLHLTKPSVFTKASR